MNYDEWIDSINRILKTNDYEIKEKLLKENNNPNLMVQLEPKLVDLIKIKFNKSVERIIVSLEEIMDDNNVLDLTLVDFKKKVLFVYDLINIKELSEEKKEMLSEMIKDESNKVYDILLKEARIYDPYGILEQTIKNNRIKWS